MIKDERYECVKCECIMDYSKVYCMSRYVMIVICGEEEYCMNVVMNNEEWDVDWKCNENNISWLWVVQRLDYVLMNFNDTNTHTHAHTLVTQAVDIRYWSYLGSMMYIGSCHESMFVIDDSFHRCKMMQCSNHGWIIPAYYKLSCFTILMKY